MKPYWSKAPDWARYMAQDESGDWFWYEKEPRAGSESWSHEGGRYEFARAAGEAWRGTLEERP